MFFWLYPTKTLYLFDIFVYIYKGHFFCYCNNSSCYIMAHMYAFFKCFWLSSHCYDFSDALFTIIVWAGYYHYYASHSQTITNEILYLICIILLCACV